MINSAIFELSNLRFIRIIGEKAADFLQGQVTCDVREINPNQTRRAAHCNPKGRVLSAFRILQPNQNFYLLTPSSISDLVIEQLKKYAVFSKVTLEQDNSLQIIGCSGHEIAATLSTLFDELPSQPDQAAVGKKNNKNLLCIRTQGEIPRFEIVGEVDAIDALQKLLLNTYPLKTSDDWRLLDINSGIATIYPQTQDLFTPQMLNYPALQAVSFKKGCYVGQEIIARTHYLGKAKRHLHTLCFKGQELPKVNDAIYNNDQQLVGIVVDSASQGEEIHLLAVLQDEAMKGELYWRYPEIVLTMQ